MHPEMLVNNLLANTAQHPRRLTMRTSKLMISAHRTFVNKHTILHYNCQ